MLIRILLVLSYIFWCCRFLVAPWKYFQLNANYFNQYRQIFSKLDMDLLIPKKWRLTQVVDRGHTPLDEEYPVFLKPEWGQNSQGVCRIDNFKQLQQHRLNRGKKGPRYLMQSAAKGKREFEIFYIPGAKTDQSAAIISVTETCNRSHDAMPVNGIYNQDTFYKSCMTQLSEQQIQKVISLFTCIGHFKIARYCARADSLEALLAGQFSIVEVNVYVPMPLILLVKDVTLKAKLSFVFSSMKQLALVTKDIPGSQVVKSIFFQKLKSARVLKSLINKEFS
ncbi:hypothetical protein E2R68_10895 [Psychromonas sp. RZ22]|uniref:hypothetical protein n=1 Tax=Psychromonas algarum TaxID=2555643 RepID=UPI001068AA4E|nr:hypothetical protein [Psychromonas sp. RZ22]TEW53983.1 hypothetical protein E2R68_10895 [Psychromonas sp. RZ22]